MVVVGSCGGGLVVWWWSGRVVIVWLGGGVHQVNDDRSRRSPFGCHVADSSDVAPSSRANVEQRGMGGEYSPGTKATNDD